MYCYKTFSSPMGYVYKIWFCVSLRAVKKHILSYLALYFLYIALLFYLIPITLAQEKWSAYLEALFCL